MREVAKVTRFNPNERHEHMTRFVRGMQGVVLDLMHVE